MEWLATLVYAHFERILVCECVVQQDLGIGHRAALIPLWDMGASSERERLFHA
jgi:hypothetical protein